MGVGSRVAVVGCVLLGLCLPSQVSATVMTEVPLSDMIRDADAIVHGVVDRSGVQVVLGDHGPEPQTVTTIRVTTWLAGAHPRSHVSVREIGGTWRGGGHWIAGTPRYAPGEEVVVFLRRDSRLAAFRTYAMAQGKFVVRHGAPGVPPHVGRDLSTVAFARWSDGRMGVTHAESGPLLQLGQLFDLIREVRGWVEVGDTASRTVRP